MRFARKSAFPASADRHVAYCGRDCAQCSIFQATQRNDKALRIQAAAEWSTLLNMTVKSNQICCHGCLSQKPVFFYCEESCRIRKIGIKWSC